MGCGYSHRRSLHNWQVWITFILPRLMRLLLQQKQNKVFQKYINVQNLLFWGCCTEKYFKCSLESHRPRLNMDPVESGPTTPALICCLTCVCTLMSLQFIRPRESFPTQHPVTYEWPFTRVPSAATKTCSITISFGMYTEVTWLSSCSTFIACRVGTASFTFYPDRTAFFNIFLDTASPS